MRRPRPPEEEQINETWLIPYADILTLLLALFIILFASSQLDQSKFERLSLSFNEAMTGGTGLLEHTSLIPDQGMMSRNDGVGLTLDEDSETEFERRFRLETETLQKLQQKLDQFIEEEGLADQFETQLNYKELKIDIKDHALFASGSAAVTQSARTIALSIAQMLRPYPEYEVVISGHTDDRPIHTAQFRSNWDLSAMRALNFMKVLLEDDMLKPERFSAVGFGEYRPIADNKVAEGRAQNRRVEISLLRKFPQSGPNE